MHYVNRKEFRDALLAYKLALLELPGHMLHAFPTDFFSFIQGDNHSLKWYNVGHEEIAMDDEAYQKFKMALSPHGHALLAAWAIRELVV